MKLQYQYNGPGLSDCGDSDWDFPVYIVAGGPSAANMIPLIPSDAFVLGVNNSAFHCRSNALFSLDSNFIQKKTIEIRNFKGQKYFAVNPGFHFNLYGDNNAVYVHKSRLGHVSLDKRYICGLNSGYGAIHLAVLKGAKKIALLGLDMTAAKKSHWHGGYAWGGRTSDNTYNGWFNQFAVMAEYCAKNGIMIYNCNLESRLDCFPKKSIVEVNNGF
ncbi:MAG: hypothetical protein ABFD50_08025 [Smithella sp.]